MAFGLSGSTIASLGGAALGLLSDGGGGSGPGASQTVSKDPWSAADPWLRQNIQTGQNLQNYYQQNPFNAQQQKAYGQLSAGNDYINQLVPGLLSQLSGQTGFDRSNPSAKPAPISFNTSMGFGQSGAGSSAGTGGPITDGQYTYQPGGTTGWQANINGTWTDLNPETTNVGWLNEQRNKNMNVANNPFANGGIQAPAPAATAPAANPMQDEMSKWWLENTQNRYNMSGGGGGGR